MLNFSRRFLGRNNRAENPRGHGGCWTGTTSEQHMIEDLQAELLTLSAEEIQRIETIAL
jgi:hypothetical protein